MRNPIKISVISLLLIVFLLLVNCLLLFYDFTLFAVSGTASGLVCIIAFIAELKGNKRAQKLMENFHRLLPVNEGAALKKFPLPALLCDKHGEIIWYNDRFKDDILEGGEIYGRRIDEFFSSLIEQLCTGQQKQVSFFGKYFNVTGTTFDKDSVKSYILYFDDVTTLQEMADEYLMSRPAVMLIAEDNAEDIFDKATESEKLKLFSELNSLLDTFISSAGGFIRLLGNGRYVAVVEERALLTMIEDEFSILKTVQTVCTQQDNLLTVSIGVGRGGVSLLKDEEYARQALDMALGRGGDQVAIKTPDGYEFFGAMHTGELRRTRVRARMIAKALMETIKLADKVIVTGHKASDFDSIGACVGLASAVRSMKKECYIALNYEKSMGKELIDRCPGERQDLFIEPSIAADISTDNTLLIICDTHIEAMLESRHLYQRCKTTVVIDHHRKMVGHIKGVHIFYHQPNASSSCEMVAELIEYLDETAKITRYAADAMIAGIMLDTKNFALRTGIRTFEVAAFLRRNGADTISVKKLFRSSLENQKIKAGIMSGANVLGSYALVVTDVVNEQMLVIAPQIADEFLDISGIEASFVVFVHDGLTRICARSLGNVNVQVLMEQLGGGGHNTMAGTQLECTAAQAYQQLLNVLNKSLDK